MTQGPTENNPYEPTQAANQQPGGQPPGGEHYGYGAPPPPPPGQPAYQAAYGAGPIGAPYGVHPMTGIPYSDKQKVIAGILQILVPIGVGRFYIGDSRMGVIQLLVTIFTCGIGALWPFIDGIIMLATDSKDVHGYMLR